jgi:hypothetical protein
MGDQVGGATCVLDNDAAHCLANASGSSAAPRRSHRHTRVVEFDRPFERCSAELCADAQPSLFHRHGKVEFAPFVDSCETDDPTAFDGGKAKPTARGQAAREGTSLEGEIREERLDIAIE